MATRQQHSLKILSGEFLAGLAKKYGEAFSAFAEGVHLSVSQRANHGNPNLAVLCISLRKLLNLSQTEMGTNKKRDGKTIWEGVSPIGAPTAGNVGGSWFSAICNVEQGGKKTDPPQAFLEYLAAISGLSLESVSALSAEDTAIRKAFTTVNAVPAVPAVPENVPAKQEPAKV